MIKTKSHILKATACIIVIFVLIIRFSELKIQIQYSLKLWTEILIPSLFPYLVLSQYISSSGFLTLCKPLNKIICKIFNISTPGAGVYLCSLLCGYPSGAVCTANLFNQGLCTKSEAERLICFTNNPGPMFLISAVGGCMLGSVKDGVALYIIQVISAMLIGICLRNKTDKKYETKDNEKNAVKTLNECCTNAISTLFIICAQVVTWSLAAKIISVLILSLFDTSNVFIVECSAFSFFELSSAMSMLSALEKSSLSFALICACCSWGGVSVIMQIKSCLPKNVSVKRLIIFKIIQSGMSFILAMAYKNAFEFSSCYSGHSYPVKVMLGLSLMIFLYYILSGKKKHSVQ
ncbi:MAG: hypothetical protein IJB70_01060 [Clostridia bacterium]|nr:hypothetical protein [Clostridia bacterium]